MAVESSFERDEAKSRRKIPNHSYLVHRRKTLNRMPPMYKDEGKLYPNKRI